MTIKKLFPLGAIALFLIALFVLSGPAGAQLMIYDKIMAGTPVGKALTAVNTDTAIVIKYVGSSVGGGEVAVDAGTGDITLTVNTAADTTTECPIAGAYGGVIDVNDASCNTLGEVIDAINFSANWRAAIVAGLRSDAADNALATIGATTADAYNGLALKWDTAVAHQGANMTLTVAVMPDENLPFFLNTTPGSGGGASTILNPNPWRGTQTALFSLATNLTSAGTITNQIYSVKVFQARGAINAAGTGFTGGSETVTTLFNQAGGATTVEHLEQFWNFPLLGNRDEKIVIVANGGAAATTVPSVFAYGNIFRY